MIRRRRGRTPEDRSDPQPLDLPLAAEGDDTETLAVASALGGLLASPPQDEDLAEVLAAGLDSRRLPRITLALAAATLVGFGFLGGALAGKYQAPTGPLAAPAGGSRPAGPPSQLTAGAPFPPEGGNATIGTVKLVDGRTIYVQDLDGSITKVITRSSTDIRVTRHGSLSDVRPGTTIVVQGSRSGDGTVTASRVSAGGAISGADDVGGAGG